MASNLASLVSIACVRPVKMLEYTTCRGIARGLWVLKNLPPLPPSSILIPWRPSNFLTLCNPETRPLPHCLLRCSAMYIAESSTICVRLCTFCLDSFFTGHFYLTHTFNTHMQIANLNHSFEVFPFFFLTPLHRRGISRSLALYPPPCLGLTDMHYITGGWSGRLVPEL